MHLKSLLTLAVFIPLSATAADFGHSDLTVGVSQQQYSNTWLSIAPRYAVEASFERAFRIESPLRLGFGIRGTLPSRYLPLPFDAFLRARIAAKLGFWEPAAGPEFGVTGWGSTPTPSPSDPGDWDAIQKDRLGPLYFSFGAAPLRFRLSRFTVSALELQLGVTFPTLGSGIRIGVGLLSVGYQL